jgi:CBS domain containing-hemolysin-like protein
VSELGWLHALLLALLSCSAFFSGSEAALFCLTVSERRALSRSAEELLAEPRGLLATILLANLVVNSLYFAFASRLLPGAEGWPAVGLGFGVLVGLLVFGEILPKIMALRARRAVARVAAPVLRALVVVMEPLARPLLFVTEAVHRAFAPWVKPEGGITPDVLARVLARGAVEGALHEGEADLLSGIIELDDVRVREIMRPRVDVLFLDVSGEERERVTRAALAARLTWLPVIDAEPDPVVGKVNLRDLVRHPERSIRMLVVPVTFVPEVASALDVLRSLRGGDASEAVVVDEFGGTAGIVTVEHAFEHVLGDLRVEGEEPVPTLVPLGEGRFRVPGGLPIREWNEAFGLEIVPREFETVGGFVTALLGRIPRAGDQVHVGALELSVHEVRRRRVLTVDIGVRAGAPSGNAAGNGAGASA